MTAGETPALAGAWGLPFAGMLLSIALLPVAAPDFWHRHAGKLAVGWSLAFLVPFAAIFGLDSAVGGLARAVLIDYLPFVVLLAALYTTAGGIEIAIDRPATPAFNTALLAIGAACASVIGTTGASMVLIRPLLQANAQRHHPVHVVVFFIFIVANIGGALTPLGDPPLFIGFLQGVGFFWTTRHLLTPMVLLLTCLLAIFYLMDTVAFRREAGGKPVPPGRPNAAQVTLHGAVNLLPLLLIIGLVLTSGIWKPGLSFRLFDIEIGLAPALRDVGLVAVGLLSLAITPAGLRARNHFSWSPILEVAQLFLGIFVTMIPVIAMLQAGEGGPLAFLVRAVKGDDGMPLPWAYFWVAGLLSSFLDNAPTYLVFFKLAGGDARQLMAEAAATLMALSAGAVFMGANSYIGNAPNFMIKAIAEDEGVRMPGFFGYLVWSGAILVPLFAVVTVVFFL